MLLWTGLGEVEVRERLKSGGDGSGLHHEELLQVRQEVPSLGGVILCWCLLRRDNSRFIDHLEILFIMVA